ncbi:hypothetical protein [Streptomyces collinus]
MGDAARGQAAGVLAVGRFVGGETVRAGRLHVVEDFFHDLSRHG